MWERKKEYSRYFYASFYNPWEVNNEIMDKATGLTKDGNNRFVRGPARQNREDFIFHPWQNRQGNGGKKFVLVTDWDPRHPDILICQK